jgi:hypothetical protein
MKSTALLIALLMLLLAGCKDLVNKDHYEISKGERITVYASENGSARYREYAVSGQVHIKYTGSEVAEASPRDCDGCSTEYGYTFEGASAGTDTIFIMHETYDYNTGNTVVTDHSNPQNSTPVTTITSVTDTILVTVAE